MIRLRTLGDSTIEIGGTRIGPDSVVLFGLVVYLAMQEGRPVPRARLRELFWPDTSESRAWHSLRQFIDRLRSLGIVLQVTKSHVTLDAAVVDFDLPTWLAQSPAGGDAGDCRSIGAFLDGYAPEFSAAFADWLEEQRAVVHAQLRRHLLSALGAGRLRSEWTAVERLARTCLRIDPLNEEATLALAEATAFGGAKVEAMALLDRYASEVPRNGHGLELPPRILRRRIAERLPGTTDPLDDRSPFVGRADSMELLSAALQRALGAHGQSIHVWGPAGIGKTRLIQEFERSAVLLGVEPERLGARFSDNDRPLSVISELVRRLLGRRGAIGCSPTSLDYLRRLAAHDPNASTPEPASGEAEALRIHLRRAVFDLLDAVAGERCLVMLIEDVHWADEASVAFLREIARWVESKAVLLVCTSRAGSDSPFVIHALPPLRAAAARALIEGLSSQGAKLDEASIARCIAISEGNPLHVRELVRHWRETGDTGAVPASLTNLVSSTSRRAGFARRCGCSKCAPC